MISVIIPIYNSAQFLEMMLKSVMNQSYTDFEVICVDDGSTDDSPYIAQHLSEEDSRFRLYRKPNGGVSSARNYGLEHSRGEYICFADSDDILHPEYLSTLTLDNRLEDASIGHIAKFCDEHSASGHVGRRSSRSRHVSKYDYIPDLLARRVPYPTVCSVLYRRSIIDQFNLRFNEHTYWGEDTEFWMMYLVHCDNGVLLHDAVIYFYRMQEESAMHNFSPKALTSFDSMIRLEDYIRRYMGDIPLLDTLHSYTALKLAYMAAMHNRRDIFAEVCSRADMRTCARSVIALHKPASFVMALIFLLFGEKGVWHLFRGKEGLLRNL